MGLMDTWNAFDRRMAARLDVLSPVMQKKVDQVLASLDLLRHHKINPTVEGDDSFVQISFNAPISMAEAYVDQHIADQMGKGKGISVSSGGSKIYIDLNGVR